MGRPLGTRPRSAGAAPIGLVRAALVGAAIGCVALGCITPPRQRAGAGRDEGYPTCGRDALPEGEVVAARALRAGPVMVARDVVERFEIRRRDCVEVFTGRQTWSMSTTDVDVVYDADTLLPLRVWKRIVSPGSGGRAAIETRRFELRGGDRVALAQRTAAGALEHWTLRPAPSGGTPRAIVGPGRGLLTMWLRRARLEVGGRLREPVLDVRESMEEVREVTLARLEDRDDERLGRVRVYTIYGREPFYADDEDVVVGDMMGMLPAELVPGTAPVPTITPPDPDPRAPL